MGYVSGWPPRYASGLDFGDMDQDADLQLGMPK